MGTEGEILAEGSLGYYQGFFWEHGNLVNRSQQSVKNVFLNEYLGFDISTSNFLLLTKLATLGIGTSVYDRLDKVHGLIRTSAETKSPPCGWKK